MFTFAISSPDEFLLYLETVTDSGVSLQTIYMKYDIYGTSNSATSAYDLE